MQSGLFSLSDEELDDLIRRRDAGDDDARDAIDAWVSQCLECAIVLPERQPYDEIDAMASAVCDES